jgi:hypothetical protein
MPFDVLVNVNISELGLHGEVEATEKPRLVTLTVEAGVAGAGGSGVGAVGPVPPLVEPVPELLPDEEPDDEDEFDEGLLL